MMKKIFTVYHFIQLFLCGVEPFKYRPNGKSKLNSDYHGQHARIDYKGCGSSFLTAYSAYD